MDMRHESTNNYEKNNKLNNRKIVKKPKKRKVVSKVIKIIFLILSILFIVRMFENGWTYGGFLATILGHNSKTVDKLEPIYVVVTGESQNLTDAIMICKFDPKAKKASIISVPRDTFIGQNELKATSNDKINTLYSRSPEKLLAEINRITGLNIKYYINIDTKGLREVVDSMGGVYFNVPIDMNYDDDTQDLHINLKAGYQLLDGDKAEQLLRFRHNNDGTSYPYSYGDNDIGRMKTQRAFIKAMTEQVSKKRLLFQFKKYIKIAKKNVTTNFDFNYVIHYVPYVVDFNMEDLETTTLPGTPKLCNNIWLFIPDKQEIKKLVADF